MKFLIKNIKLILLIIFISNFFTLNKLISQELIINQNLSFGTFAPSISTTNVIVYPNGSRSIVGNAIPLGLFNYSPAIFTYTSKKGKSKDIVHIIYEHNILIINNSYSMSVKLGPSNKHDDRYRTEPNTATEIKLGGILTIKSINQNPSGTYVGTFFITIIQE